MGFVSGDSDNYPDIYDRTKRTTVVPGFRALDPSTA